MTPLSLCHKYEEKRVADYKFCCLRKRDWKVKNEMIFSVRRPQYIMLPIRSLNLTVACNVTPTLLWKHIITHSLRELGMPVMWSEIFWTHCDILVGLFEYLWSMANHMRHIWSTIGYKCSLKSRAHLMRVAFKEALRPKHSFLPKMWATGEVCTTSLVLSFFILLLLQNFSV